MVSAVSSPPRMPPAPHAKWQRPGRCRKDVASCPSGSLELDSVTFYWGEFGERLRGGSSRGTGLILERGKESIRMGVPNKDTCLSKNKLVWIFVQQGVLGAKPRKISGLRVVEGDEYRAEEFLPNSGIC